MKRTMTPTRIALAALGSFAVAYVAIGLVGWGPPASNESPIGEISRWCERVRDGLMREPVNTLGNLGFVAAGLIMFRVLARDRSAAVPAGNRFYGHQPLALLYAAAAVFLGPGSMVMHGTHTFFGAWIDNLSMVAYILIPWLFSLSVLGRWSDVTFFKVYGIVVAAYAFGYWFFGADLGIGLQLFDVSIAIWIISEVLYRWWSPAARLWSGLVGFVVAAVFGITPVEILGNLGDHWWMVLFWVPGAIAKGPATGRRQYTPWFWAGIGSFLVAYTIWLTGTNEHSWCRPDSLLQAHAIWHLLTALATWCFFMFLRTEHEVERRAVSAQLGRR
ncbi:MAG: ceramidase [bacterium]|nr:ceramidase [bacterium]